LSYDLYFWRYIDDGAYPDEKVKKFTQYCVALIEGNRPKEIASLPSERVKAKVAEALVAELDWTHDERPFWLKGGADVIEVFEFHAGFSPRGAWGRDATNRLMDVMKAFTCPLFDAQTRERFAL